MPLQFDNSDVSSSGSDQDGLDGEEDPLAAPLIQVGFITCERFSLGYKECSCIALPTSNDYLYFKDLKNSYIPSFVVSNSKIENKFPQLSGKVEKKIKMETQYKKNAHQLMCFTVNLQRGDSHTSYVPYFETP